jgi:hypothetical protein
MIEDGLLQMIFVFFIAILIIKIIFGNKKIRGYKI